MPKMQSADDLEYMCLYLMPLDLLYLLYLFSLLHILLEQLNQSFCNYSKDVEMGLINVERGILM